MFKPMLAATLTTLQDVKYPVFVSPKFDGIRALVIGGVLVSRTLKPIPNLYTRALFSKPEYEGLDGELIVGSPTNPDCFNVTTSAVMRQQGTPDVHFYVFDQVGDKEFLARYNDLWSRSMRFGGGNSAPLRIVAQRFCSSPEEAEQTAATNLALGYEGSMLKSINGPYKHGRSTVNEGTLLKFKPYEDDEAVILAFVEQMTNNNPAKTNVFGRTERSSAKENLTPADKLGALHVRNSAGQEFSIGTGWNEQQATMLWSNREALIGCTIAYRFQREGMKDLPRFPSFKGLRDD